MPAPSSLHCGLWELALSFPGVSPFPPANEDKAHQARSEGRGKRGLCSKGQGHPVFFSGRGARSHTSQINALLLSLKSGGGIKKSINHEDFSTDN